MRKLLLSLFLASAAASPVLAEPPSDSDAQQTRQERRAERQEARSALRQERSAQRPSFTERRVDARSEPSFARRDEPQVQRPDRSGFGDRRIEGASQARFGRRDQVRVPVELDELRAARDARRESRSNETVEQVQQRFERRQETLRRSGDLRQSVRPLPNVLRERSPLIVSDTPRPGTQPPLRAERHRTSPVQWNTHWRNDRHYDWQDHRRRNRWVFHLGFYNDPFGWNYNPYQVGWRMWPSYYSSRYWINDPWQYRLPYAPPGYRWIRYWDDALLVDTWTGEVVDSIRNFFW